MLQEQLEKKNMELSQVQDNSGKRASKSILRMADSGEIQTISQNRQSLWEDFKKKRDEYAKQNQELTR